MRHAAWSPKHLRFVIIALIVVGVAVGLWYVTSSGSSWLEGWVGRPQPAADVISSGFIEADEVSVSPEVGGRIVFIGADEGDTVLSGALLVRLDDALLRAQQRQAEAAVNLAMAGLKQAEVARDGAKGALDASLDVLANPLELKTRIAAAQAEFELADLGYEAAKNTNASYWDLVGAALRRDVAQRTLNAFLAISDHPQAINAAVVGARSTYDRAVAAVEMAERQVDYAKASLLAVDAQISRLSVTAPINGVVVQRAAAVGEVAQPRVAILTLADLREVVVNVYVAESKLGLLRLGQRAEVSVDSYPGETFRGEVVFISARGLFTPGNIQLKEEREKVVFPVKIRVPNPEAKLKVGMPADAVILLGG